VHVRLVRLAEGEAGVEAGLPPAYVYLPMGAGLTAAPLGSHTPCVFKPWILLGISGIIGNADPPRRRRRSRGS